MTERNLACVHELLGVRVAASAPNKDNAAFMDVTCSFLIVVFHSVLSVDLISPALFFGSGKRADADEQAVVTVAPADVDNELEQEQGGGMML